MMLRMRTTVTLDPEVNRLIETAMHRERKGFKQVVNEAIRRGLAPQPLGKARKPLRVMVHSARLLPGVDRRAFNRLADKLDDEAILADIGRRPD
jgi:hypothetical protein